MTHCLSWEVHALAEICIVNCGLETPAILSVLRDLQCSCVEIRLKDANTYPFRRHQGIVISGGTQLFTDETLSGDLIRQFSFIDDLTVPTLGICLGHQAIGISHGVKAYRGPERRRSDAVTLVKDHMLVQGIPSKSPFVEDHCEGIPLPDDFTLIGFSDHYDVEIMACESKPLFGVQFHPEVSGEPGKQLFRNFVEMIRDRG